MRAIRRALLPTLATLLLFASSATAECAWVLWGQAWTLGGSDTRWKMIAAYQTGAECRQVQVRRMKERDDAARRQDAQLPGQRPPVVADQVYECWPDTIDPRAPKGGGR